MRAVSIAELLGLLAAILLWIPAYRASLIKLSQSQIVVRDDEKGAIAQTKRWLKGRLEARERVWTATDNNLLFLGFIFLIASYAIKLIWA